MIGMLLHKDWFWRMAFYMKVQAFVECLQCEEFHWKLEKYCNLWNCRMNILGRV